MNLIAVRHVVNNFDSSVVVQELELAIKRVLYEPRHDKTNKVAVRPAKTQISLGIRECPG